ncbi:hypothetical protein ACFX2J_040987 [Malus domestica]
MAFRTQHTHEPRPLVAALEFRSQIEKETKRREEFTEPWKTRAPLGFAAATLSVVVLAAFLPLSFFCVAA